jgi:hypothetical protein
VSWRTRSGSNPLEALGVFKNPPEPQTDAEGVERVLPWPEGDYLVRIATVRPEKVAALLKPVASSRNPWVQRAVISAGSSSSICIEPKKDSISELS